MAASTVKPAESSVGLVSCACWDHHATLKWRKSGFLLLSVIALVSCGLIAPYLTIVIRNIMPALLPLISQAGGEPPSNGLFAIFMQIGCFVGAIVFLLLFVSINQRNTKNHKLVTSFNKTGLLLMSVSWLGLIMTVCFPVGYTDVPNKFQWVVTVLYEHSFAATLILVGLAIFQYLLIVVWWYLPDTSRIEKYTKLGFGGVYIIFFLMTLYPLPAYILEELGPNIFDFAYMRTVSYSLPTKYTTAYLICAVCEWSIVILSIINLATLYKDLQRVSCRIVFRHKSCLAEEPSISLKIISS